MELRSYNVERVYKESVKCVIAEDLGIDKTKFKMYANDIRDMLYQIKTVDGKAHLCACNRRVDDEIWTPYLQIVGMLIRMGKKLNLVSYEGKLKPDTLITIIKK